MSEHNETANSELPLLHADVVGATMDATGLRPEAVAAAVNDANAKPAKADPLETSIADIHARLSAVENVLNIGAEAVAAGQPSLAPMVDRLSQVETAVNAIADFLQKASPQLELLWNHFGSKL